MRNVLVIEDQQDIAHLVELHLRDLPCKVELAFDGHTGLAAAEKKPFDLVVLDLMLPGIDGLEVCRQLRSRPVYTPIMMLTAKAAELDRVLGLELGADDYLTKPFSIRELVARVKALFRRIEHLEHASAAQADETIQFGHLHADAVHVEVLGIIAGLAERIFVRRNIVTHRHA